MSHAGSFRQLVWREGGCEEEDEEEGGERLEWSEQGGTRDGREQCRGQWCHLP